MKRTVLITGGCGYIGSHTAVTLLNNNYNIIILDNLTNSNKEVVRRIHEITSKSFSFIEGDIRDSALLREIFSNNRISSVIHFAGLKSVSESNRNPIHYYENNISGTINLIKEMNSAEVYKLVFSSSATVYGAPETLPIDENHPTNQPTNPYGRSKLVAEEILSDVAKSNGHWRIAILRYFNPIGAHKSGLIGECPNDIPNNLIPYISQVAIGKLKELTIHGDDYPTKDGTGIRDYIHVCDLAEGHLKALDAISLRKGVSIWNLGTGRGYSVFEVIQRFETITKLNIPYVIKSRRDGDVASCWANPEKAHSELNWKANLTLNDMLSDTWNWQRSNPNGYK